MNLRKLICVSSVGLAEENTKRRGRTQHRTKTEAVKTPFSCGKSSNDFKQIYWPGNILARLPPARWFGNVTYSITTVYVNQFVEIHRDYYMTDTIRVQRPERYDEYGRQRHVGNIDVRLFYHVNRHAFMVSINRNVSLPKPILFWLYKFQCRGISIDHR